MLPRTINLHIIILLSFFACEQKAQNKEGKINVAKAQKTTKEKNIEEKEIKKETSSYDNKMTEIEYSQLSNLDNGLKEVLNKIKNGDTVKIVCYGNSITNGYKVGTYGRVANPYPETFKKLLKTKFKNNQIQVINEGHNGWKSNQALQNIKTLVLDKKPDLVTLMFGINDAYSNFSLDFYKSQMETMIEKLQAENIVVLILTPTPILTEFNGKVLAYIEVLKTIAKEKKIAFLNLNKGIVQKAQVEKVDLKKMLPDDVHFADDKYAWLGELIFEFFISL